MTWPFGSIPRSAFGVILVDFPWQFETWSDAGKGRAPERHYPTMSLEEGMALPVWDLAARNCAVASWIYDPMIPQGLAMGCAWGFDFKTRLFDWDKDSFGLGYYSRAGGEQCWLFTKGSPRRRARDVRQYHREKPRQHSRKPDEFHRRLERLFDGPYLELFARQRRRGWVSWGNEIDKFGVAAGS